MVFKATETVIEQLEYAERAYARNNINMKDIHSATPPPFVSYHRHCYLVSENIFKIIEKST